MKVVRRREDAAAGGAAAAPVAAAKPTAPKVLVRAAAPPKVSKEEEDSQKVAALLAKLSVSGCDGAADVAKAVADAGFNALQVGEGPRAPLLAAAAGMPRCAWKHLRHRMQLRHGAACGAAGKHRHLRAQTAPLDSQTPHSLPNAPQAEGLVAKLKAAIEGTDADAREAALLAVGQLPASAGRAAEPYLLPLVPLLLERAADKAGPARDAACASAVAVARSLCPHAAEMVLPVLFAHTEPAKKWQTREAALRMLAAVSDVAPRQVAARLPEIVPLIATLMVDPREQVRAGGRMPGIRAFAPDEQRQPRPRRFGKARAGPPRAALCAPSLSSAPCASRRPAAAPGSAPLAPRARRPSAAHRSSSPRLTPARRATTSWATATLSTWWTTCCTA
jgi:hypothetical protein